MTLRRCFALPVGALALGGGPVKCNNELFGTSSITTPDSASAPLGGSAGNLIKLPQPAGEEATFPAALDGSPFAFYFLPSATNSTKWTINIQGGGWCYDEVRATAAFTHTHALTLTLVCPHLL
jgi:hypothetical protein